MWDYKYLSRIDLKLIPCILALMGISVLVIASMTATTETASLFTSTARSQVQWFAIGWLLFFLFVGMDYRLLRSWSWIMYGIAILLLLGLFFTAPIQHVHRWYRLPFLGREFQPSEYAKLAVVIALSTFLESRMHRVQHLRSMLPALGIVMIPFILILKQPDLGTALVLYPTTLAVLYVAGVHKTLLRWMMVLGGLGTLFVALIFTGALSHEQMKPYALKVLKEYQYERLNPYTYHQTAAQTAIGVGGLWGCGWLQGEFAGKEWLPAAHTDSVFAAFGEEFGLVGIAVLLMLFFGLIYFSFRVTAVAKDPFGKLLATGITAYLATQTIVNIGMMVGFLPITGIPLTLVTYGGSSVVSSMMSLGILQSIYSRRFMF